MKRIISIVLIGTILSTACSSTKDVNMAVEAQSVETEQIDVGIKETQVEQSNTSTIDTSETETVVEIIDKQEDDVDIYVKGLDDEALLQYVEENMYSELVKELNSEEYFVEKIEAVYYPKEYIESIASNSQTNIYFGYTAAELDEQLQGTKYVFTLGSDGQTCVAPIETISDDVYVKALEEVIVGTGSIMISATVSAVSAPSFILTFVASAKTGTAFVMKSGAMSLVAAIIAKGYETESFEQAINTGVEVLGKEFMDAGVGAFGKNFKCKVITGVFKGNKN